MVFGTSKYRYTVAENWEKTPDGWKWGGFQRWQPIRRIGFLFIRVVKIR